MSITNWLILMLVVLLGTTAQLSLKYALHSSSSTGKATKSLKDMLFSRYFLIWFVCYVLMTILWLFILRIIPLSQAFPVLGLMFALVPIASHYLLKEEVVFRQWLGIAIIITGVIMVVH